MSETVIRAAVAFLILYLITRATGRSTLGELSSFDLLLFITMGDLVQQGITRGDLSLSGGVISVATFGVLAVVFGFANVRWPRGIGNKIAGSPVVLIYRGVIDEKALRTERISINELRTAARQSQVTEFDDVSLAILEPNGKFSFFTDDNSDLPNSPM